MNDPYRILNIKKDATEDEIREAYRKLAAKYHPDVHENGPLSDIAKTKMEELNEAFDRVMDIRRGGGKPASQYRQQSHGGDQLFAEIRRQIQLGNLAIADEMLDKIETDRNAEWSFLKGCVCHSRGWLNDAYHYFSNAVKLDSQNAEYNAAYTRMTNSRNGKTNIKTNNDDDNPTLCSLCSDCCCDCAICPFDF